MANESTEFESPPPTPGVDDSPYIRHAINSLTRDEHGNLLTRPNTGGSDESYPVERIIPDEGLGYLPGRGGRYAPVQPVEDEKELDPLPSKSPVFIPVEAPKQSPHHQKLTFKPMMLRSAALLFLAMLCILEIAGIAFCISYSKRNLGLWDYQGDRDDRYFVFEYLPQILATVIVLFLFSVERALVRIMPFVSMSSGSAAKRSSSLFMPLFPTNLLLPRLSYFRAGYYLVGCCFLVFWISLFAIPLQSSLFQAQLLTINDERQWRWVIVQPVAYILLAMYALLVVTILTLLLYFARRSTGLKWDPTSLADLIVMLQRSNALADYRCSETFATPQDFRKRLHLRSDRLGYWKIRDSRPTTDSTVFYAMGEEGAPIRTYTMLYGKVMPTTNPSQAHQPPVAARDDDYYDLEAGQQPPSSHSQNHPHASTNGLLQAKIYSPEVRYRYLPFALRPIPLISLTILSFALLFAFVVASYTKSALTRGFPPLLRTTPSASTSFSPAGFLYSFLPSLLGLILALLHQSVDFRIRALEPFSKLSSSSGATAESSLLLDYTSCSHLECAMKALLAGDYLIFFLSLNSLLSFALPILAGGIFWAISFPTSSAGDENIRMLASPTTLAVLLVFLILYCLSLPLILLTKLPNQETRRLPHDISSLAEVISFLYASPLLDDPLFYATSYTGGGVGGSFKSKMDLVTRLLSVAPGERDYARFAFGIGKGRDGKEHLGIDRLKQLGTGKRLLVNTGLVR